MARALMANVRQGLVPATFMFAEVDVQLVG